MAISTEVLALTGVLPQCGCKTPTNPYDLTGVESDCQVKKFEPNGEPKLVRAQLDLLCGRCKRILTVQMQLEGAGIKDKILALRRTMMPPMGQ
jgi:hypothetical protein